jgi:hypothetical protein
MMRESDQTQRMKSQGELVPERKTPLSSSKNTNSNAPLMTLTPISSSTTTTSHSSSAFFKDLTSSLMDQNPPPPPTQPFYGMSTSQTMPSLIRPTIPQQQQQQQQQRPTLTFSSSSNKTNLTSSLLNNINSLGSRPQATSTTIPMNSMNTNSSMPSPYFNSGPTNSGALFQPPPPPGSTVIKGSTASPNVTRPKSAASELDDLFN